MIKDKMLWIISAEKLERELKWAEEVDKKIDSITLAGEVGLSPEDEHLVWEKKMEARINIYGKISTLGREINKKSLYHVFIGGNPREYFTKLRKLDFELASFYNC